MEKIQQVNIGFFLVYVVLFCMAVFVYLDINSCVESLSQSLMVGMCVILFSLSVYAFLKVARYIPSNLLGTMKN